MTYGLYQRINGIIYFTELAVDIKKTMNQHTEMVDLLILEKKQVLNKNTKPYIPESQRSQQETNHVEENVANKQQNCTKTGTNFESIINESLELLQEVNKESTMLIEVHKRDHEIKETKCIDNKLEEIIAAIMDGVEIDYKKEKKIT